MSKDLKTLIVILVVMVITAIAVNKAYGETPTGINQETTVVKTVPTKEQLEEYNKEYAKYSKDMEDYYKEYAKAMKEYSKEYAKYNKEYAKAMKKYNKESAKYDKEYAEYNSMLKEKTTKILEARKEMAAAATNTDYRIAKEKFEKAQAIKLPKLSKSPKYPTIEMPKYPRLERPKYPTIERPKAPEYPTVN